MPIRTAREAFLANPARAPFEKLAETREFDVAAEYALLTFIEEQPETHDPNVSWGLYSQVEGAKRVLAILRSLHLKQEPPKQHRLQTLKPPQ